MSRIVPAVEFDLIEQVISECPEGIGISALEKALALQLPKALNRRALQRRLERLQDLLVPQAVGVVPGCT